MTGRTSELLHNIGPKGRNRRLLVGCVVVFATYLGIIVLLRGDVPLWYWLVPAPLFWFGSLCVVQALQGT